MVTTTIFLSSIIAVLSGIFVGIWLSKVAEEELEELKEYLYAAKHIMLVVSAIFAASAQYLISGILWWFPIFALIIFLIYMLRKKDVSGYLQYFSIGLAFFLSSFHGLFFSVALVSCIFMVICTSIAFHDARKKKKFFDRAFLTLKSMLLNVIFFVLPLIVGVWYSG